MPDAVVTGAAMTTNLVAENIMVIASRVTMPFALRTIPVQAPGLKPHFISSQEL